MSDQRQDKTIENMVGNQQVVVGNVGYDFINRHENHVRSISLMLLCFYSTYEKSL